jgi:hypothetical protein
MKKFKNFLAKKRKNIPPPPHLLVNEELLKDISGPKLRLLRYWSRPLFKNKIYQIKESKGTIIVAIKNLPRNSH